MTSIMYATMEWLWDSSHIRINLPDGSEIKTQGSYPEVVAELTRLGSMGWEVCTCVSGGNWLYWTLKKG